MRVLKLSHSNGETYEGELVREDQHRIWIKISTGKTLCIWRTDIKEML